MREPSRSRLPEAGVPSTVHPDVLDETVVHDPTGRPWLVCTVDMLYGLVDSDPDYLDSTAALAGRYETQVYYTARAGIRGFPTGHGHRFLDRTAAVAGHRRWCLMVRLGAVLPDTSPDQPL